MSVGAIERDVERELEILTALEEGIALTQQRAAELAQAGPDAIIVATFDKPKQHVAALGRLGLPAEKFLRLRRLAAPDNGRPGPGGVS